MSYGPVDNSPSLGVINQQLLQKEQILGSEAGGTRFGWFNNCLVEEHEVAKGTFPRCQEELAKLMLDKRKPKLTKLRDRQIDVVIPVHANQLCLKVMKNMMDGFSMLAKAEGNAAEDFSLQKKASTSDLKRYFPDDLLQYTQQNHQNLYDRIMTASVDQLGDLAREAKEEKSFGDQAAHTKAQSKTSFQREQQQAAPSRTYQQPAAASANPVAPEPVSAKKGTLSPAVLQLMNTLQAQKYSSSGVFHSTAWTLSRINTIAGGQLDDPELLNQLESLANKIAGSREYQNSPVLQRTMADAVNQLPASRFKQYLEQRLTVQSLAQQPPVQSRTSPSPYQTPQPKPRSNRSPSGTPSPVRSASTRQQPLTPAGEVASRIGLNQIHTRAVQQVFDHGQTIAEIETAVGACAYLGRQGCQLPFGFLLEGMARYPDDARSLVKHKPGEDPAFDKTIADNFLRKCVLGYARFGPCPPETERYLTTINLWHEPDLLDKIQPIHQWNDAYTAINGQSLSPDLMVYALSAQKMSPKTVGRINALPASGVLQDAQNRAARHPDINRIAQTIDGSGQYPSSAAVKVCKDVALYASGKMTEATYNREKEHIDKALDAISYSWVPNYLNNQTLLYEFIGNTLQLPPHHRDIPRLAQWLEGWHRAREAGQGVEFFNSLAPGARQDLRKVYDHLALANLQNFSQNLLQLEPFISGAVQLEYLKNDIEISRNFKGKAHQDMLAERYQDVLLRPGQRTIADGNCGFAAIAMLTGDSPQQVRNKARQAALDMQSYMDNGNLDQIRGDDAYKKRVKIAALSFQQNVWIEGLDNPGKRAGVVGLDPTKIDLSKDTRFQPEAYWMTDEDQQYLAVAYGRPVFPFAEVDEGNRHFAKYVSADGELKYCLDDKVYKEGLVILRQKKPAPLALINMGEFGTAHWMPMVPAPARRRTGAISRTSVTVAPLARDEALTSIRQSRLDQQRYLETLKNNPDLIPAGQNFLPRPESPKYYESLGQSSLEQPASLHGYQQQWLREDPMMSIQQGAIDPQAGMYNNLTSLPPASLVAMPGAAMPSITAGLTSLNIQQPPVEQLAPANPERTPGFTNFGARTCFFNAGMNQQIVGMTMAEVAALKEQAFTLRRHHPGIYQHKYQTTYGERTQIRDGGKRANVMLKFAELAEKTMRARSGKPISNIKQSLLNLHKACYELGRSTDIESSRFKTFYPKEVQDHFEGPQQDAHEFMGKLLEIVDEDNLLSSPLSQGYEIQTTDGSGMTKNLVGAAQNIIQVPIKGSLQECLAPHSEDMGKNEWLTFEDGQSHAARKTDFYAHPDPRSIRRLKLQVKAWEVKPNTVMPEKLTQKARNLVLKHPFERINVPLKNSTTGEFEPTPMEVKTIVAHIGDNPAGGHYITFEQHNGQWYRYDDEKTFPVNLKIAFEGNDAMVPYMFGFEKAV
ncbi:MAG: hypothetical protein ACR2PT_20305 [Endozoicomonas sp.]